MATPAQVLASQAIAALESAGISVTDTVRRNAPAAAQFLIVISAPLRSTLRAFLAAQLAQLKVYKAQAVSQIRRGDVVSDKISQYVEIARSLLAPIDQLMSVVPLDSVAAASPDVAKFLKSLADSVPLKIPEPIAQALMGAGAFDFFEGVQTYGDLRRKIDELGYRLQLAASASRAAETGSSLIDEQISQVDMYLKLIDTLSGVRGIISISPLTFNFGQVPVGSRSAPQLLTLTNASTIPASVAGTVSLPTGSFSLLKPDLSSFNLAEPGSSVELAIRFSPPLSGLISDQLTITHDADGEVSPFTVSLSGRGV